MKRHYRANAAVNGCTKWYQFDTIKPASAHSDDRQRQVRIHSGVAMPRKMFPGRDHSVRLNSTNERRTKPGGQGGIFSIRARVDDRIRRIVVDIQNWRIRDV